MIYLYVYAIDLDDYREILYPMLCSEI